MIDITFDFRSDTPRGKDPDTFSPTLRRYHQLLWSKPLPSGELFELDVTGAPPYYLHHCSELGEFWLSSDAVAADFWWLPPIIDQIPEAERERFDHLACTIGGRMVFPAQRVGGKQTINAARAFHPRIKDRFDLTVECIRRHYLGESSPLASARAVRKLLRTVRRLRGLRGLLPPAGPDQRGRFRGQVLHAVRRLHRLAGAGNPRCVPRVPPTRD